MSRWYEIIPRLEQAIFGNFPDADPEAVSVEAGQLYDHFQTAGSIEWIERRARDPLDDLEALKRAGKKLRDAAELIGGLGYQGGIAINDYTMELARKLDELPSYPVLDAQGSVERLAQVLRQQAEELRQCAERVDLNPVGLISSFGLPPDGGKKRGAPQAFQTRKVTLSAKRTFERFAGTKASVVHDRADDTYGGPFVDFLTDIFVALDIEASAVNQAREVCRG